MPGPGSPGRISVYTLGHSGVILDKHPLEQSLPDDSLTNASNATHDPQLGHLGALRSRAGLRQFNTVAAGGAILGGIAMPVAGTGGAPTTPGTNTSDPSTGGDPGQLGGPTGTTIGSGNQTGAPGATTDGGAANAASPGANIFGGGTSGSGTVFSGRRLILIGRDDNTTGLTTPGAGWYKTTASYATDTPVKLTSPGPPTVPDNPGLVPAGDTPGDGTPGGVSDKISIVFGGWLYYAQQIPSLTADDRPIVRKTNGAVDVQAFTIPRNNNLGANQDPDGTDNTQKQRISSFCAGSNGLLYVSVIDKYNQTGTDDAGKATSVYAYNPQDQTVTTIVTTGGATGSDRVFMQMELFTVNAAGSLGGPGPYLFTGDFIGQPDISPTASISAWVPRGFPPQGLGVADLSSLGDTAQDAVTTMIQYNGRLWFGTRTNSASPTKPFLQSRDPNVALGAAGAWTAYSAIQALLPAASNFSRYVSMAVAALPGATTYPTPILYISYFDYSTSKAIIFSAVPTNYGALNSAMTFTAILTQTAGGALPLMLQSDNGVLYAIRTGSGSAASKIFSSTDGATFDAGTALPTFGSASYALPGIFFGVNQT